MSSFWSLWVMFLVVFNAGVTLFLFLWAQKVEIPVLEDGTTGHVWAHGVLREGVRKLPLWWVLLSGAMFLTGFTYLYLYPGFGAYTGKLGWTSHQQLANDVAEGIRAAGGTSAAHWPTCSALASARRGFSASMSSASRSGAGLYMSGDTEETDMAGLAGDGPSEKTSTDV